MFEKKYFHFSISDYVKVLIQWYIPGSALVKAINLEKMDNQNAQLQACYNAAEGCLYVNAVKAKRQLETLRDIYMSKNVE